MELECSNVSGTITLCLCFVFWTVLSSYSKDFRSFILQMESQHAEDKLQLDDAHDDKFQSVSNDTAILVYSAYYDSMNHTVRVIAITKLISPTLYCLLRYFGTQSKYIKAEVLIIPGHHSKPYKAVFILCGLKSPQVPYKLSISKETNIDTTSNMLNVKKIPTKTIRRNFTVCLSPLHYMYKEKQRIMEWLEMNILLGVERFYVYVRSCTKNVSQLLQTYQNKGYVAIMNWTLPSYLCYSNYTEKKLHYCGQLAALNDCLYRTKGYSSYVVVLDVDEFIIPQEQQDRTWYDMLMRLPKASTYNFRSVFFFKNNSNTNTIPGLITQSCFFREDRIYKKHKRSKYFAVTDKTDILGIHFSWKLNGTDHTVSPKIGLVHHYRENSVKDVRAEWIQSNITKKYSIDLQKRMNELLNE